MFINTYTGNACSISNIFAEIRRFCYILEFLTHLSPVAPSNTCILLLYHYNDRNILEDSYWLLKHFPDFWEYRIASFNTKFFIKGSNSVLPEQEIQEIFYYLKPKAIIAGVTKIQPSKIFYSFFH